MKFKILLITAFFNFNLFASDVLPNDKCIKNRSSNSAKGGFLKWFVGLKRFAATASEIENSPCKSTEEKSLNLQKIRDYLNARSKISKQTENANINGVELNEESAIMIDAFKNLTTAILMLHVKNPKDQKNMQAIYNINPSCKKVMCAVEKIWGPEMGPKMLYLLMRYSFNGSEYAYLDSTRFEKEELDDVILALDDIPSFFRPLGRENQRLSHFTHNMTLKIYNDSGSQAAYANGVIMLFDGWSEFDRLQRQYHVFHELAHNLAVRLDRIDISQAWRNLSEWGNADGVLANGKSNCFVSHYAETSTREDFAESVAAYRYNAEWFKEKCPEKYQFLKTNVFRDLEYLDSCTCSAQHF